MRKEVLLGGIGRQHGIVHRVEIERVRVGVAKQILKANGRNVGNANHLALVSHVTVEHCLEDC